MSAGKAAVCALGKDNAAEAQRIIEQLRFGLPPSGHVRDFTVGPTMQLRLLEEQLNGSSLSGRAGALLIKAGYGGGKSHLLQLIREAALDAGYATSLVVANAAEGVRFDRVDAVLGAVSRQIEVDTSGRHGAGALFNLLTRPATGRDAMIGQSRLSSRGRWDYSEYLRSPAMYVAVRAWVRSDDATVRAVAEDWLTNPGAYREQRRRLYDVLVHELRDRFKDPRPEWKFFSEALLTFGSDPGGQAWTALGDLDAIARAAGLRGLVLLFDEAEDLLHGLPRVDQQQQALLNLLRFFDEPNGVLLSFFAVTPDFVERSKRQLLQHALYDFDYARLDRLPALEVPAIEREDAGELACRIRAVHALAYRWDAARSLPDSDLAGVVDQQWRIDSPDRLRRTIQATIEALDARRATVAARDQP